MVVIGIVVLVALQSGPLAYAKQKKLYCGNSDKEKLLQMGQEWRKFVATLNVDGSTCTGRTVLVS